VLAANFLAKLFQDSQTEKKFCGKLYCIRPDGIVVTNIHNYEIWIGATQLTCSKNILPQRKLMALVEISAGQIPQLSQLYDFADRIGDSTLSSEFMDQLLAMRRVIRSFYRNNGNETYADGAIEAIGQAYLKRLLALPTALDRYNFEIQSDHVCKCYQVAMQAMESVCREFKQDNTIHLSYNAIQAISDCHTGVAGLQFDELSPAFVELFSILKEWGELEPMVHLFAMNFPLFGPTVAKPVVITTQKPAVV
jgi:hypothetical protein